MQSLFGEGVFAASTASMLDTVSMLIMQKSVCADHKLLLTYREVASLRHSIHIEIEEDLQWLSITPILDM